MSVLVKGMEMPENCKKCRCSWYDFTRLYCEADGKPWGLEVTEYAEGRHPNCPLIEIPPHGRLIDADALMNDGWTLHKQVMRMGGYAIHEMPLDNPNVSIVIPADKDGGT